MEYKLLISVVVLLLQISFGACGILSASDNSVERAIDIPEPGYTFCRGKYNGYYTNPTSNINYINCVGGLVYVVPCPHGQIYNSALKTCVTGGSNPSPSFCTGKRDGNYANPKNRHSYVACSGGLLYIMPCPDDLVYNAAQDRCDWDSNGGLTTLKPNFCTGKPDGKYPHPSDPNKYIECGGGSATEHTCPAGYKFNPVTKQCELSGCGCNPFPNFCTGKPNGNYPIPNDPDSYINCQNGNPTLMHCPAGHIFNAASGRCEIPGCTCNPSPNFCTGKPNGNYANPNNPHTYIACCNGIPVEMRCPAGLIYNAAKDQCDWPGSCLPNPGPNFCTGKPNGNYVNPNNPNSYISCSNGLIYIMQCPAGLVYNPDKNWCDWPSSGNNPGTGTPNPGQGFCNGKPNGNYANPNDPHSYIACSNGYTYVMPCPSGLVYNASKDWCDWPPNSGSGGKPDDNQPGCQVPLTFCRNKIGGNYVNPNSPYSFIMCSNHLTYIMKCPAGLVYNDAIKVCDFPTASL